MAQWLNGSMTQCTTIPCMLALALTGVSAAAAVAAGYQSMAPTGQWYGRTFTGLARGSRQIALTYDDGPNDPHTLRLLEVLAKHDVHATFFLIGRYVQQRPEIAREIIQTGHVVGNHTFKHPLLIFQSEPEIRQRTFSVPRNLAGRDWRTLQSLPPSVRRTPARGAPSGARTWPGASHVECHGLRLERTACCSHRAQGCKADSRRRRDPAA